MMQHADTLQNTKSGSEVAQKFPFGRLSKTHRDFWNARLFKRQYKNAGKAMETSDWCARIQFKGRRETFNLQCSNRAMAAERAKDIYVNLAANGWD